MAPSNMQVTFSSFYSSQLEILYFKTVKSMKCFTSKEESSKIFLTVQMILDYKATPDSFAQSIKARFFAMGAEPNNFLIMHGFVEIFIICFTSLHACSTVLVFQIFIPLKQGKISFGFKKLALSLEGLSF